MATKIPESARVSFSLNTGVNPGNGAMIKRTVSVSHVNPGAAVSQLNEIIVGIRALFEKPVVLVTYTEISSIIS